MTGNCHPDFDYSQINSFKALSLCSIGTVSLILDPSPLAIVNPCFSFLTPYESAPVDPQAMTASISQFSVRAAQPLDLTNLADILADSFHSRTGIAGWAYPLLRLGIYEDLRNRLRSTPPQYQCLVAVAAIPTATGFYEEIVGTVEIALRFPPSWQPRGSKYPYISNLAVKSSCRRQGAAKQLLLACERTALEWGYSDLYLHVLENNHQARQLYLKSGYQLRQVEPNYGAWLLGRPKRLFLQKHLPSA